jgi:hypothetical protein
MVLEGYFYHVGDGIWKYVKGVSVCKVGWTVMDQFATNAYSRYVFHEGKRYNFPTRYLDEIVAILERMGYKMRDYAYSYTRPRGAGMEVRQGVYEGVIAYHLSLYDHDPALTTMKKLFVEGQRVVVQPSKNRIDVAGVVPISNAPESAYVYRELETKASAFGLHAEQPKAAADQRIQLLFDTPNDHYSMHFIERNPFVRHLDGVVTPNVQAFDASGDDFKETADSAGVRAYSGPSYYIFGSKLVRRNLDGTPIVAGRIHIDDML